MHPIAQNTSTKPLKTVAGPFPLIFSLYLGLDSRRQNVFRYKTRPTGQTRGHLTSNPRTEERRDEMDLETKKLTVEQLQTEISDIQNSLVSKLGFRTFPELRGPVEKILFTDDG